MKILKRLSVFSHQKFAWSLVVFVTSLLVYSSSPWFISPKNQVSTDILPTTFTPVSLVTQGDFDLNEFKFLYQADQIPYYLVEGEDEKLVSFAPPLGSVLALPVYRVARLVGFFEKHNQAADYFVLEKIAAVLITSVGMTLMFLVFWELTRSWQKSLLFSVALGLGTNIWSTAATDLWQHTPLFLVNALFSLTLAKSLRNNKLWPYLGLILSLSIAARITSAVNLIVVLVFTLVKKRQYLLKFVLTSLVGLSPLFIYNHIYFGSPLTFSYSSIFEYTYLPLIRENTLLPVIFKGTATLLFAPSGGFLFYSPVLLLGVVGAVRITRRLKEKEDIRVLPWDTYAFLLLALILGQVLLLGSEGGRGGINFWGSRFSVDFLPFWIVFLLPAYDWVSQKSWRQALAGGLLAFSIFVQIIGVYFYRGEWDAKFWPAPDPEWSYEKDLLKWWSLKDGQLVFTIRQLSDRGRPTEN